MCSGGASGFSCPAMSAFMGDTLAKGTGECPARCRLAWLPDVVCAFRPMRPKKPGCTSLSGSLMSSRCSGNCAMPSGGCTVFRLDRDPVPGRSADDTVFLLRKPSHSNSSFSPIGSILSSCILFASSACRFVRTLLIARTIPAPPRMVSALGSYSGSSCSTTVRT